VLTGAAVAILLSNGDGTFAAPSDLSGRLLSISLAPRPDNDGSSTWRSRTTARHPERCTSSSARAPGTFAAGGSFAVATAVSVTIADFNNDAQSRFAVTAGDNDHTILLGAGNGHLSAALPL